MRDHGLRTWPRRAPDEWDTWVDTLGGTPFHTSSWTYHVANCLGGTPLFFAAFSPGGELDALLPSLVLQPTIPVAGRVLKTLHTETHPVLCVPQSAIGTQFVETCFRYARSTGCIRVELGSFGAFGSAFSPRRNGFQTRQRLEMVLDLTGGSDGVWKGIRSETRRQIRKARREGVAVASETSEQAVEALRTLHENALNRKRAGQEEPYQTDPRYFRSLRANLLDKGVASIHVARMDGEIVSATATIDSQSMTCSVLSGSSARGYRARASKALRWHTLEVAANRGLRCAVLGGVPVTAQHPDDPSHGLYRFKAEFGAEPRECSSGLAILRPLLYSAWATARRIRRSASPQSETDAT